MLHIGIDFSITSPCICFWDSRYEHTFENSSFFFLSSSNTHKNFDFPKNITFEDTSSSKNNPVRFSENAEKLTNKILAEIESVRKFNILLEGYSMGAKGRLFDIGEATGIFKYFLSNNNLNVVTVAPTAIKKMATGKGNANKFLMLEKFIEINIELKSSEWIKKLTTEKHLLSPLTDIVDSFFIANSSTVVYDQGKFSSR